MKTYVVTDLADSDLSDIWAHIANDNATAADRLNLEFEKTFEMLATHPRAGRAQPEFGLNVRSFPVGAYVIFYSVGETQIVILRVLHGRRDLRRIFTR